MTVTPSADRPWTDPLYPGGQGQGVPGWGTYYCEACDVRWSASGQCWMCGAECPSVLTLFVAKY